MIVTTPLSAEYIMANSIHTQTTFYEAPNLVRWRNIYLDKKGFKLLGFKINVQNWDLPSDFISYLPGISFENTMKLTMGKHICQVRRAIQVSSSVHNM